MSLTISMDKGQVNAFQAVQLKQAWYSTDANTNPNQQPCRAQSHAPSYAA